MTGLVPILFKSPSLGVDPAAIPRLGKQLSLRSFARHDFALWFGGGYPIDGIIKVVTTPARKRVRLYESSTGVLLQELWSDASTGAFRFPQLSSSIKFTLTATDDTGAYDDIILQRITPPHSVGDFAFGVTSGGGGYVPPPDDSLWRPTNYYAGPSEV